MSFRVTLSINLTLSSSPGRIFKVFPLASLVAQKVNDLRAMQKTGVRSLGQEDSLEQEMATHSSILENSMERGAWWAIVHRAAKNWT